MSDYRRWISYIYAYENGVKRRNAGYAKLELKDGQLTMTLHVTPDNREGNYSVCLYKSQSGHREGVLLGKVEKKQSREGIQFREDAADLKGSGLLFQEMNGLLLYDDRGKYLISSWEDGPVEIPAVQEIIALLERGNARKSAAEKKAAPEELEAGTKEGVGTGEKTQGESRENAKTEGAAETRGNVRIEAAGEAQRSGGMEGAGALKKDTRMEGTGNPQGVVRMESTQEPQRSVGIESVGTAQRNEGMESIWGSQRNVKTESAWQSGEIRGNAGTDSAGQSREVKGNAGMDSAWRSGEIRGNAGTDGTGQSREIKESTGTDGAWQSREIRENTGTERMTKDSGENERKTMEKAAAEEKTAEEETAGEEIAAGAEKKALTPTIREREGTAQLFRTERTGRPDWFLNPENAQPEEKEEDTRLAIASVQEENDNVQTSAAPKEDKEKGDGQKADAVQEPGKLESRVFSCLTAMYPFEHQEFERSARMEPQDIGLLPREMWKYAGNSFLLHSYYAYHHILFARKVRKEGRNCYLMLPGIYNPKEQHMAQLFGFSRFCPVRKKALQQGDFGYWYMEVEFPDSAS